MKRAWLLYHYDPYDGELEIIFHTTEPEAWGCDQVVEIVYAEVIDA